MDQKYDIAVINECETVARDSIKDLMDRLPFITDSVDEVGMEYWKSEIAKTLKDFTYSYISSTIHKIDKDICGPSDKDEEFSGKGIKKRKTKQDFNKRYTDKKRAEIDAYVEEKGSDAYRCIADYVPIKAIKKKLDKNKK